MKLDRNTIVLVLFLILVVTVTDYRATEMTTYLGIMATVILSVALIINLIAIYIYIYEKERVNNMDNVSEEDKRKIAQEVVLTAPETANVLGVTTQRLHTLVKQGRITPLKVSNRIAVYFRPDVEKLAEELAPLREKFRPFE
jgi:ethanolamine transporter EutH